MKLNLVSKVTPPMEKAILCAYEDETEPFYFIGMLSEDGKWYSNEYGAWEFCGEPQYWCYLPTID